MPRPKGARDAGFQHPAGEVTPQYTLVHQGHRDLTEAWNDPTGQPCKGVPRALIVRITLPGVVSAAAVQLDVTATRITAAVPGKYLLDLPLPFCITSDGSAKFDRDTAVLTLTLPVSGHKAGNSNKHAAVENVGECKELPPCNQNPAALDPAPEGCEGRGTVPEHTAGSSGCLVQVLGDAPDSNTTLDQVLSDAAGAPGSQNRFGEEEHTGTSVQCETDEAGAAAIESPGVRTHLVAKGERDGGAPAVSEEAAGSAPVLVPEKQESRSGPSGERVDPDAEDACPVPLSHTAAVLNPQEPSCKAESVGSKIQGSAVGEVLDATPLPPVSRTDDQGCAGVDSYIRSPEAADQLTGDSGGASWFSLFTEHGKSWLHWP